MMTRFRNVLTMLAAVALALAAATAARAQSPTQLLESARARLEDIQPDSAAALATRALDRHNNPSAADQERCWLLLGIAEVMRNRPFVARQAFRHALERNNSLRIDSLAYLHSDLRNVFETERATFQTAAAAEQEAPQAVTVRGPMDINVVPGQGRYTFEVRASKPTRVVATITSTRGDDVLWADSAWANPASSFNWDLTANGAPVAPGRYALHVVAPDANGRPAASFMKGFQISRVRVDTMGVPDVPQDSLLPETKIERRPSSLLAGAALGVGSLVLTSVVGNKVFGSAGDGGRFVVAGAISTAAVIGFLHSSHARPIPENVAYNNDLRDRYQRMDSDLSAENRRRVQTAPLRLRMEGSRMDASR